MNPGKNKNMLDVDKRLPVTTVNNSSVGDKLTFLYIRAN